MILLWKQEGFDLPLDGGRDKTSRLYSYRECPGGIMIFWYYGSLTSVSTQTVEGGSCNRNDYFEYSGESFTL